MWNILIVKIRAEFIYSGNILNVNESTPTFGIEVTYRRMAQVTMLRSTGSSLRTYLSLMMEFATLFQVGTVGFEKNWAWSVLCQFDFLIGTIGLITILLLLETDGHYQFLNGVVCELNLVVSIARMEGSRIGSLDTFDD